MQSNNVHPDSYSLLGACHWRAGQFDEAVEMADKAVELAPNHSFNTYVSGVVLRGASKYPEAIQRFKRAMRLSPIFPMPYLASLGACYHMAGDNDLAIATLTEAVQREPESLLPKMWLASALIEHRSDANAKSVAADILRIEPHFSYEAWVGSFHFKDQLDPERLLKNLGKAGLPA